MLVVKKYPNRRLYDTSESRYITLEDLANRIKAGDDVLVQDVQSGADLTQATLTQIILESRGGARLLPVPLLLRLIRLGDEALAEFLGRYVSWALELYVGARQGARALMPLNPLATAPFAATDALARLVLGATPWGAAGSAPPVPPSAAAAASSMGMPIPEAPPSRPVPVPTPMDGTAVPSAPDVASAVLADATASAAGLSGQVTDVADDLARLRRELEALKRSVGAGRAAPRNGAPKTGARPRSSAPKVSRKKR